MTLFIAKVICWNSKGYTGPSGDKSTSGFHSENGYGHEEWNNSHKLEFVQGSEKFRAFHTEKVGKEKVNENEGDIIVFMYAPYDGGQHLVGIAGSATCLIEKETARKELAKQLQVRSFRKDAWAIRSIKDLWENDSESWDEHWAINGDWLPNWFCPADKFFWLDKPVKINVPNITGKKKLNFNYSRHQPLSADQAKKLIELVPLKQQTKTWQSIFKDIIASPNSTDQDTDNLVEDVIEISNDKNLTETERKSLTAARLGQGAFRKALDKRWNNSCAVTGITTRQLLRASHIRPWKESNNVERLDPNNGLLLSANIDVLFDKGLVTFLDTGEMQLSAKLEESTIDKLDLPGNLNQKLKLAEKVFLEYHRENIFGK